MANEIEVQRRLLDAVETLHETASQVGDAALLNRLGDLRVSVTEGRLRIVVVGEFGNGKSTLVDSLLGEALVPTGSTPSTRACYEIIHGPETAATLVYRDGLRTPAEVDGLAEVGADLVLRLDHVEIRHPAPFLEGAALVDTPGLGGVDSPGADVLDRALHSADCILAVLNCDRLLSLTEQTFVEQWLLRTGADRIAFVLNRADGKSQEEIRALVDRARHLLAPAVPEPALYPFSALQALRWARGSQQVSGTQPDSTDPGGLVRLVKEEWIGQRQEIARVSAVRKIGQLAAELERRVAADREAAAAAEKEKENALEQCEKLARSLQTHVEETCRRATSSLQALREQFVVGLKDYALRLREGVPGEIMEVPVDEARRFLPFYIQELLRQAVEANDEPLQEAVARVLQEFTPEVGPALATVATGFQFDVEPPAIPLYVTRDRAPLSQGASMLMAAGLASMLFIDFATYPGALMFVGSFMSRELGKRLEAGDRRANLASSAQALVHGSIETMEGSITEQFKELEDAVVKAVQESAAAGLSERAAALEAARAARDESAVRLDQITRAWETGSEQLARVRRLLAELPARTTIPTRRGVAAADSDTGAGPEAGSDSGPEAGPNAESRPTRRRTRRPTKAAGSEAAGEPEEKD